MAPCAAKAYSATQLNCLGKRLRLCVWKVVMMQNLVAVFSPEKLVQEHL